jgi:hypothetical protein
MSYRLLRCLRGSRVIPEVAKLCLRSTQRFALSVSETARYTRSGSEVSSGWLRYALDEYYVAEVCLR